MLKQRNQRLSLLVPYVLLCDKNLPACSSAIIVLTALSLKSYLLLWTFFFHWKSQAFPFLAPKLTKHRADQVQFEDSIFLTARESEFKSGLSASTHKPLLDLQPCSSVDPAEMASG